MHAGESNSDGRGDSLRVPCEGQCGTWGMCKSNLSQGGNESSTGKGVRREQSAEGVAQKDWKMFCRKPFEVLIGELSHFQ